jgi:hypothetical protein
VPHQVLLEVFSNALAVSKGKREYGQAARPISTSQLHVLPRFHLWPINLVVYQGPLGDCSREILS